MKVKVATEIRRQTAGAEAVVFRPFSERLRNKIIHTEVIFLKNLFENPNVSVLYGVRGVSQIKFTMSDSFLVLYDFGILSMIKRKLKSFWFLLCHFDFKFVVFDFSNAFLISKI